MGMKEERDGEDWVWNGIFYKDGQWKLSQVQIQGIKSITGEAQHSPE
jgi:hypothetical protein